MASTQKPIAMAFFDIGGPLGERDPATGKLIPFPSTVSILATVRDVISMRIGIIPRWDL